MRIGVPTEVKNNEYRVGMTPVGVRELTGRGHEVLVQAGAGVGSSITQRGSKWPFALRGEAGTSGRSPPRT